VAIYIVDRELPGYTLVEVSEAQRAAIRESERFTASGRAIRYLRSTFVPAESHCMCLFDAADAATVEDLNREARIPFTRVVEAVDMTPPT
jgi:hypothetical protein